MKLVNALLVSILITIQFFHTIDTTPTSTRRVRREVFSETRAELNRFHRADNTVAYFSGEEIVRYRRLSSLFTLDRFTVQFWIRLEGGQTKSAPILVLRYHCQQDGAKLVLGVRETESNMRFFMRLRTESAEETIESHDTVPIDQWTLVTGQYDGNRLQMFVNRVRVASNPRRMGVFLRNHFPGCAILDMGGDAQQNNRFRGHVDRIELWNVAKTHSEIAEIALKTDNCDDSSRLLIEEFDGRSCRKTKWRKGNKRYYGIDGRLPTLEKMAVGLKENEISIPACGITECDNPEIVRSYSRLLLKKQIKYSLIKLSDDDGTNPLVSDERIAKNHRQLNDAFRPYNISWRLHVVEVRNSLLRRGQVEMSCFGHCPHNCKTHQIRCSLPCARESIGNGVCDPECNHDRYVWTAWDGGDCCNPNATDTKHACYDPSSVHRAFISSRELREAVRLDNRGQLTVLPVNVARNEPVGKGTFPWAPGHLGLQGGITISAREFGSANGVKLLVHEIGHVMGLWHVHKGVSEVRCNDICSEPFASMTTGDLCEDTNPTPRNPSCRDDVIDMDPGRCSVRRFTKTPWQNFMAYAKGDCIGNFTPQQTARMHCYIDRNYQMWQLQEGLAPSPIPLVPQAFTHGQNKKVTIIWQPPVGLGRLHARNNCKMCDAALKLKQFAVKVTAKFSLNEDYNSSEATGAPDAVQKCILSPGTWYPSSGCKTGCFVDFHFAVYVVPSRIKVWLNYRAKNSIKDIELFHPGNKTISLGPGTSHCNVPYTRKINTERPVHFIRIHLRHQTAIDAVQIWSNENDKSCKRCRKLALRYQVYRTPKFSNNVSYVKVKEPKYVDLVSETTAYSYQIRSTSGRHVSLPSPTLFLNMSSPFCGDGRINAITEQCDDGNSRNNDGCDSSCRVEPGFNCKSEPSLCYVYKNDGVCEAFEENETSKDCGHYTPSGFIDQWATRVTGRPGQSHPRCPEYIIAGKPSVEMKCMTGYMTVNRMLAWQHCLRPMNLRRQDLLWIEAKFARRVTVHSVLLYIANNGARIFSAASLSVALKKDGEYRTIKKQVPVECGVSPLKVFAPRGQDLSTDTVRVSFQVKYKRLAFAGIALRSWGTLSCGKYTTPRYATATEGSGQNDGDHCKVSCAAGFDLRVRCRNGEWRSMRKCEPVSCPKPRLPLATTNCSEFTSAGGVCSFTCQQNSQMYGNRTTITCQPDGRWSEVNSLCYQHCDTSAISNSTPRNCPKHVTMGTTCRFQCNEGHKTLEGKRKMNAVCSFNQRWLRHTRCEKLRCKRLNDEFLCTDENRFHSTCTLITRKGVILRKICRSSGDWLELT